MNKIILEFDLKTLPKIYDDKYQLNMTVIWLNEKFLFDETKTSPFPLYFTSKYGFCIYSHSYGRIFPESGRLRLPSAFFYNKKNTKDNIISKSFNKDIQRYEYLVFLKQALEEWSMNFEGFQEENIIDHTKDKKIALNSKYWII